MIWSHAYFRKPPYVLFTILLVAQRLLLPSPRWSCLYPQCFCTKVHNNSRRFQIQVPHHISIWSYLWFKTLSLGACLQENSFLLTKSTKKNSYHLHLRGAWLKHLLSTIWLLPFHGLSSFRNIQRPIWHQQCWDKPSKRKMSVFLNSLPFCWIETKQNQT